MRKLPLPIFIPLFCLFGSLAFNVTGQNSSSFYEGERVHAVFYHYTNLPTDTLQAQNMIAQVRKTFRVFPQSNNQAIVLDNYIEQVKRLPDVANASYEIQPAPIGGIDINVAVSFLSKPTTKSLRSGAFIKRSDFPLLYLDNKSLLVLKISAAEMLYGNNNAWYGKPQEMLNGNPLVNNPAGADFTGWIEGWASAGIYGITPLWLKNRLYLYGGLSAIASGSAGRELFTDKGRVFLAVEDAYLGFVSGTTTPNGNSIIYNLSVGRQQFAVGQGFIIRNTASNGGVRAALQLNPRWAADLLALAAIRFDNLQLKIFYLDPNELPEVDSQTKLTGIDIEGGNGSSHQLGFMFAYVPHSSYRYYTLKGENYSRKGLQVFNLRYFGNQVPGKAGIYYKTEIGYERNTHFEMNAFAGYGEVGWSFAQSRYLPTVGYRFAYFSGDNPNTKQMERWDPLLSGGNAEEWIIGANHFKIVQNSNLIAHRIQCSLRPYRKIELVPQFFYLRAPSKTNLGGNPALSILPNKEYGFELNMTVKYFYSRKWYLHGHIAYTIPGKGVTEALGHGTKPWFSVMAFVRYSL